MTRRTVLALVCSVAASISLAVPSVAQVVKWGRPEHSTLPGLGKTSTLFAADAFSSSDLARMRLKGRVTESCSTLEVPDPSAAGQWTRAGAIATMKFDPQGNLSGVVLDDPTTASTIRVAVNNEFSGEGVDRRVIKRVTSSQFSESAEGYNETTTLEYDSEGRLTSVRTGSGPEPSSEMTFDRDATGRPESLTSSDDSGETQIERFDPQGRLAEVAVTTPNNAKDRSYRVEWTDQTHLRAIRTTGGPQIEVINATLDNNATLIRWTTCLDGTNRSFQRDVQYDSYGNWTRITMFEFIKTGSKSVRTPVERWTRVIAYAN